MGAPELSDHKLDSGLIDREMSWLDFNARVLELAGETASPALERAKFLAIFATNLDEFFQIRVAGLKDRLASETEAGGPGLSRAKLQLIAAKVNELVKRHVVASDDVLALLGRLGVDVCRVKDLSGADRQTLRAVFEADVLPVLTPLGVDAARPFAYISNLSLNLAVLVGEAGTAYPKFARVKVPSNLARLVPVGDGRFVFLEDVITSHLGTLFPGLDVLECHAFRITRNADLDIQDDEADDLMATVELELRQRRFGRAVRLEVAAEMTSELIDLLVSEHELDSGDVYVIPGPLDCSALWELVRLDRPDLKEETWPSAHPAGFAVHPGENIFDVIRRGDVLVHHPYESFSGSVLALLEAAAADPGVLAIKQTLYRTSGDSPIVDALVRAAELGKQVVVLVELKARFDEQNNIAWARKLERAGAHVMYGLVGLKTHAKAALIVRADDDGLRRYCHLGTGNYNPSTARLYEDIGLFTADPVIGADVAELFNSLTGFSRSDSYRRLLVAPFTMRDGLLALVETEAAKGGQGRIVAKMNSLADPAVIAALYKASAAGVPIDLIVRGICCLRPGVPALSENIRVRSVVGRFLEHSRIYSFGVGGSAQIFIGSADMMQRNLDHRVETLVPVEDPTCRRRIEETLELALADDVSAWSLEPEGTWRRIVTTSSRNSQGELHRRAVARTEAAAASGRVAEPEAKSRTVRSWPLNGVLADRGRGAGVLATPEALLARAKKLATDRRLPFGRRSSRSG